MAMLRLCFGMTSGIWKALNNYYYYYFVAVETRKCLPPCKLEILQTFCDTHRAGRITSHMITLVAQQAKIDDKRARNWINNYRKKGKTL